jgi:hypothetical protein
MALTSFQARSTSGGGTLKIWVTDTDFIGSSSYFLTSTTGLSLAGGLSVTSYLDSSNKEFTTTGGSVLPLGTLDLIPNPQTQAKTVLSGLSNGSVPYSLTIATILNHKGAGISTYSSDLKAVPEPITLLGSGLAFGFGVHLKRKLKKVQPV